MNQSKQTLDARTGNQPNPLRIPKIPKKVPFWSRWLPRWGGQLDQNVDYSTIKKSQTCSSLDLNGSIDFRVLPAQGGVIVETTHYDTQTNDIIRSLYVINDDQDLGSEVAKIVNLGLLKL